MDIVILLFFLSKIFCPGSHQKKTGILISLVKILPACDERYSAHGYKLLTSDNPVIFSGKESYGEYFKTSDKTGRL
jgi:hypothetical protein